LESVYENAFVLALAAKGMAGRQQVPIPVSFRGHIVGSFAADILVENTVILELKALRAIEEAHRAQLMNYLRATEIEIGLLLNFGQRPEFKRLVLDNDRKKGLSLNRISVASLLVSE
jgi:GxxExxY protein